MSTAPARRPHHQLHWLGIGAQRAGTTWFTDLLVQHPRMRIVGNGQKEQHALYATFPTAWTQHDTESYLAGVDEGHRWGEFTPYYLRSPWTAVIAKEVLRRDAPILVLLRDPVARFESAIRLELGRSEVPRDKRRAKWIRALASDATWAGMYATQLQQWASAVGRARLLVLQYERVRQDPAASVARVWRRLELDPVPLTHIDVPSKTTSDPDLWNLEDIPGLREGLMHTYADEVARLGGWGIETSLWGY